MGSFDLFSEKAARDSGFDSNVTKAFLKESDDLEKREYAKHPLLHGQRQTLNTNDKMGLACAGLIVGSPLFLLGLGGTFAFCDQMDFNEQQKQLGLVKQRNFNRLAYQHAAINAEREKLSRIPEFKPGEIILPVNNEIASDKNRKPEKLGGKIGGQIGLDQVLFSDNRRNNRMVFRGKNWLEAHKLLKLKTILEDQIKILSQKQDYHTVCKLSSELELLDKALKRLG
jgi:hypothetical protein